MHVQNAHKAGEGNVTPCLTTAEFQRVEQISTIFVVCNGRERSHVRDFFDAW
jgi:hypothetical protein